MLRKCLELFECWQRLQRWPWCCTCTARPFCQCPAAGHPAAIDWPGAPRRAFDCRAPHGASRQSPSTPANADFCGFVLTRCTWAACRLRGHRADGTIGEGSLPPSLHGCMAVGQPAALAVPLVRGDATTRSGILLCLVHGSRSNAEIAFSWVTCPVIYQHLAIPESHGPHDVLSSWRAPNVNTPPPRGGTKWPPYQANTYRASGNAPDARAGRHPGGQGYGLALLSGRALHLQSAWAGCCGVDATQPGNRHGMAPVPGQHTHFFTWRCQSVDTHHTDGAYRAASLDSKLMLSTGTTYKDGDSPSHLGS